MNERDAEAVAMKIAAAFELGRESRLFLHALPREDRGAAHAILASLSRLCRHTHLGLDAAGLNPPERIAEMNEATAVLAFSTGIAPAETDGPDGEIRRQLTAIEEARRIPFLLCALPNARKAAQISMPVDELERMLVDAITLPADDFLPHALHLQRRLNDADGVCIRSPHGCELTMSTQNRVWHLDDGVIDAEDRRSGAIVSNLPTGSLYVAAVEESVCGSLFFASLFGANDVRLDFSRGVIERVTSEFDAVEHFFEKHTGDAKRIGHIGLGLNPRLRRRVNWPLIDEHVSGSVFISFGENRYMGGLNASSLNADAIVEGAELCIGADVVFP